MQTQDDLRKAFFNERAQGWLDNHYKNPDTGTHDLHAGRIGTIVSSLGLGPESRVLDVGCGTGVLVPYLLSFLGEKGRLFEMDYAAEMIRENQALHPDPRISFLCSDVAQMPLDPASLDAVICFACFPHFEQPRKALARMAESLVPGGRLTVAHLMSSAELAAHHHSHTPVSQDCLPSKDEMCRYVAESGFDLKEFQDRPGLYLLCAVKGA